MPACWAIEGDGQRSTHHLVFFTRWSSTGRMCFIASFMLVGRHVGGFGDVVAAADGDVGVHVLHFREQVLGDQRRIARRPRP